MKAGPENRPSLIGRVFTAALDIVEIYIPAVMLMCLFISFIVGIVFRYVFRDPQSWTFELSSISFLQVAILSGCFVQRRDEHITFDMFYTRVSPRTQCLMRILSGVVIAATATLLIPTSLEYVASMFDLKTQMLKLPRWSVFVCFPVSFLIMDVRALHRVILDCKALRSKSYEKAYPRTVREETL